MQIVIDVDETTYNNCVYLSNECSEALTYVGKVIAKGVVLPEHHGRIGDMDKLIIDVMDRGIDHIQTDDYAELCQIIDEAPCLLEPYIEGSD